MLIVIFKSGSVLVINYFTIQSMSERERIRILIQAD
jgi:hypothetical protein